MGKQKVEIKVTMVNEKKKSKVMQIIAKQNGILSIAADRGKDKITVVGNENLDVTDLTTELRRRMRCTHVVIDTVTPVDEKKEKEEKEKKEKEKKKKEEEENGPRIIHMPCPAYFIDEHSPPSCCLM